MSVRKKLKAIRTRQLIGPVGAASLALSPIPRGGAEPARSLAWGPPSLRAPADLSPGPSALCEVLRPGAGPAVAGNWPPKVGQRPGGRGSHFCSPALDALPGGPSASASSLLLSRLTFPRHKVVRPRSPERIRFPVCASPARVWSHQQRLGLAERSPQQLEHGVKDAPWCLARP